MSNKTSAKSCDLKKFIRRAILLIIAVQAVAIAVLKVIEYFKCKRADTENPRRDFKKLFNYLGSKAFALSDDNVSGVISKNILASTFIDLSNVKFREDGFISLNASFSSVNIIVPKGVNVRADGLIKRSSVNNTVPEDSSKPSLYIASKLNCSSVNITASK